MDCRTMAVAALGLAIVGCGQRPAPPSAATSTAGKPAAAVDAARLMAADAEPGNWMGAGRTYGEQHFSPLQKIDASNVKQLGLAWFYDLDAAHRGQESTPLVIDGAMYVTSAWSKVFALDAKTGALLWQFKTESGIIGQPVSFRGANGKQHIAVLSGVGGWAGITVSGEVDSRDRTVGLGFANVMKDLPKYTVKGGKLHVFALP